MNITSGNVTITGVHFVDCLSNMTVTNIRRALVKKKECIEKLRMQTELRAECTRILDEHEQHQLYTSRLRDFQIQKQEKETIESRYHEICDFYSKKDVYHTWKFNGNGEIIFHPP